MKSTGASMSCVHHSTLLYRRHVTCWRVFVSVFTLSAIAWRDLSVGGSVYIPDLPRVSVFNISTPGQKFVFGAGTSTLAVGTSLH